ncbi:DUF859 family phage minor structural protein [Hominifimenecus sp. rT4P-3]|uniref:DUF859 family phage minor structural protein n=1 Tax=Hominifimenecus sp. rT4P-3 TaxID=3242979 RepID=UPI003DA28DD8
MSSYNYYNPSSSNSAYMGKFAIVESNNVNANSSTITWAFGLYRNDSYQSSYSRKEGNHVVVSINGSEVFNSTDIGTVKAPNGEGNAYILASGTTVVGHNGDGTKTFSFSAKYTNSYSSSISPLEVSGSHVCNSIPRGSTFSIGSSSLYLGQSQSYSITRYSSAFKHRISMTVKDANNLDATVFLQDGVDTTLTATVPWSIVQYMYQKNLSSVTVTTHMLTYSGTVSNVIGAKSTTFTAKIPAASLSLSSANIAMGSSTTVNIARKSNYLNYKVSFAFGQISSQIATIATGSASSYAFSPSVSTYASAIPSAKSGTGTVTVSTYCGTTLIGSSSANLTLSLPSNLDYTPSFTEVLSPGNTQNGYYLKGRSTISGSFSNASVKYGAGVKTQRITINGTSYGNSFSNVPLSSAGTYTIVYYLEDTRGYSKTATKTIQVSNYEMPKITSFQVERCGDGNANCKISYTASYFKPASETYTNSAAVKLVYGSTVLSVASYTGEADAAETQTVSLTDWIIPNGSANAAFSTEKSYSFRLEIYDSANGNAAADTKTVSIQSLFYLLDFKGDQGIALGKGSVGNGLEVNFDSHFYKTLEVADSLVAKNGLELYQATPHIDFHHNNSTSDYTARIIADGSNTLNLAASGGVKENGTLLSSKYAASSHSHNYAAASHTHNYAAASHTHSYLPLSGGTLSGNVLIPFNRGFYWNATNKGGRIYCSQDQRMYFGASNETNYYIFYGVLDNRWAFCPDVSGYMSLGSDSKRWDQLFARSGTINTSDRNEKKEIKNMDAELAKQFIKKLSTKTYKFIESTSNRTHWGLISQEVEDVMEELGIDSTDFAGFIKSPKYVEQEDENGQIQSIPIEGEYTYGLRYDEFIAPMISAIQSLMTEVESLKEQLAKLVPSEK